MLLKGVSGISDAVLQKPESFQPLKDFAAVLKELMDDTGRASSGFAEGKAVNTHTVMINAEKAIIGLSLALQLRNRAIEAYQEIMHMQV